MQCSVGEFNQLPEFQSYCGHCLPECERTEYEVTATSGVISDHEAITEYLTGDPLSNIDEIGRIKVLLKSHVDHVDPQTSIILREQCSFLDYEILDM